MFSPLLFLGIFLISSIKAAEVCYGKYGCFNNNGPFNRYINIGIARLFPLPLPQSPEKLKVVYHVVTQLRDDVIDDSDVAKLKASSYDGSKNTVVVIHGWTENIKGSKWLNDLKLAILAHENVNLILVDWDEGAKQIYTTSVANTRLVGAQVAELIKFLNIQTGNSPASFHLIGNSLGAHVAGYAGRRLKLQNIILGRITGLDPAGPYYQNEHTDVRLDPSDAEFVDVIHTAAGSVGTSDRSGHLDFYPNGGKIQRGCQGLNALACSHGRAPRLYIDSVRYSQPFKAFPCSSWDQFIHGNCMSCPSTGCPEMGRHAVNKKGLIGEFYLYTNKQSPFAVLDHLYITFKTGKKWDADGRNPKLRIFGSKGNEHIFLERRYLSKGSIEHFIAPLRSDLGSFTKIQIWNTDVHFRGWEVEQVSIQSVTSGKRYYACYDGLWVKTSPTENALQSSPC